MEIGFSRNTMAAMAAVPRVARVLAGRSIPCAAFLLLSGQSPAQIATRPDGRMTPEQGRRIVAACQAERDALFAHDAYAAHYIEAANARQLGWYANDPVGAPGYADNFAAHIARDEAKIAARKVDPLRVGYDICLDRGWLAQLRAFESARNRSRAGIGAGASVAASSANPEPAGQRIYDTAAQYAASQGNGGARAATASGFDNSDYSRCVSLAPATVPGELPHLVNGCNVKLEVSWCVFRAREGSTGAMFDCERSKGGASSIAANGRTYTYTGEMVYWVACKWPAFSHDTVFQLGRGLLGRCG